MRPVEPGLELPRLSEGGDPALASAVADLRGHRPDAADLASLASRLALQGIAVTAPPTLASAVKHGAWKKWALAGGGAASGIALWLSLGPPPPTAPGLSAPRLGSDTQLVASASAAPLTPRARGAAPSPMPPKSLDEQASPTPSVVASDHEVTPSTRAVVTPREALDNRDDHDNEVAAPHRSASVATAARAAAAPPAASPSTSPTPDGAALAPTEIELLRDARLALKQSPGRALELTESHARAFPAGKLAQERELIAISALVALGRRTAALSRANRFAQAFPESPYRRQIGELLR